MMKITHFVQFLLAVVGLPVACGLLWGPRGAFLCVCLQCFWWSFTPADWC